MRTCSFVYHRRTRFHFLRKQGEPVTLVLYIFCVLISMNTRSSTRHFFPIFVERKTPACGSKTSVRRREEKRELLLKIPPRAAAVPREKLRCELLTAWWMGVGRHSRSKTLIDQPTDHHERIYNAYHFYSTSHQAQTSFL